MLFFLTCSIPDEKDHNKFLFSLETFKEHISPKLIDLLRVHEVQVRLLLLSYLPKFLPAFTKDELKEVILPEVKLILF